jgi:hypothetical protein
MAEMRQNDKRFISNGFYLKKKNKFIAIKKLSLLPSGIKFK